LLAHARAKPACSLTSTSFSDVWCARSLGAAQPGTKLVPVLKANNYELVDGESSIFAGELTVGANEHLTIAIFFDLLARFWRWWRYRKIAF
jgi:hypothetical protein